MYFFIVFAAAAAATKSQVTVNAMMFNKLWFN